MANTFEDYTVSTSTSLFNITFEYLEEAHIVVEIDGVIQATSTYSIVAGSPNKVSLNTPVTSGVVRIRRDSNADSDAPFVDFVNGSVLTETDLDKSYRHNLYLNEEIGNLNQQSLQKQAGANPEVWDAKTLKVVNVADPTLVQDAVTKNYVDTQISNTVTASSTLPVKTTFTGAGSATFTFSAGITLATAEAYEVAIDGVLQEPTTAYTLDADANTITFTSTPPTGSNIVVVQRGYAVPAVNGNLVIHGALESTKDRQTGTPEGGELILRSSNSSGSRWVIDNQSSSSLFRIWSTDDAGLTFGTTWLTLDTTGLLSLYGLPTYADDSAAGTGGLVANNVYKTATGELRIKT